MEGEGWACACGQGRLFSDLRGERSEAAAGQAVRRSGARGIRVFAGKAVSTTRNVLGDVPFFSDSRVSLRCS